MCESYNEDFAPVDRRKTLHSSLLYQTLSFSYQPAAFLKPKLIQLMKKRYCLLLKTLSCMHKAENHETCSRGFYLFRKENKHITACGQLVFRIVWENA